MPRKVCKQGSSKNYSGPYPYIAFSNRQIRLVPLEALRRVAALRHLRFGEFSAGALGPFGIAAVRQHALADKANSFETRKIRFG